MDNKKTRRIKMMAFSAFMMPFVAIGAGLAVRETPIQTKTDVQIVHEEYYCGAPSTAYTGYAAWDCQYYEQPDFVYDYFVNLIENLPTNNAGNCGYTALTMLLCYYDTYWNRDIIPYQYNNRDQTQLKSIKDTDFSSPGVQDFAAKLDFRGQYMEEPDENSKDEYVQEYDEYLRKAYSRYLDEMLMHTPDNFISELYDLALDRNNTWGTKIWDFARERKPGLDLDRACTLAERYFSKYGLSGKAELVSKWYQDYTSVPPKFQREYLREDIIMRIQAGQPVIVQGKLSVDSQKEDPNAQNNAGAGHCVVAYAYDKGSDQIIGHMGWKHTGTTKVSLDQAFQSLDSFAYLDVKEWLEFTPKNYRFRVNGDLMACDLASHVHADGDHRAIIDYGDPDYHALQCICGDVEYEEHFFDELDSMNAQYHAHRCKCGATDGYEAHSYDEIEPCDAQYHALKCACGDVTYEEHSADETVYHDPQKHAYKCRCGETVGYGFHYYFQTSLTTAKCIVCGDVKHIQPPFIIDR